MRFIIESARSIENLKNSGTIFACSPSTARYILKKTYIKKKTIIELGCGTGVFTKEISKKRDKDSRFIAIEINKNLAKEARKRAKKETVINDDVMNLEKITKEQGINKADIIISTLPWAAFKERKQKELLEKIKKVLEKEGEFITISYIFSDKLKNGKRFKRLLKRHFREVKKTRVVASNLPPAFFYICKNPKNIRL